MYIIDADAHISPYETYGAHNTIEMLINQMDYAGIDKTLTWIQPPYERNLDESLKYLYNASKIYHDKIIGFGWVDPHLGFTKSKDTIRRCIEEYGFYGIKMNGAQNEYFIDDPKFALPLVEEIAKTGKAIAFHIGGDAYEFTHPFRLAKIAELYPELQILMVHMGGACFADLSAAAIEVASKHNNITLIGSAIRDISIIKALKSLGSERICFGSDSPFALSHGCVAMYKAILQGANLSSDEQQKVMGGNILRVLGINELI
ncbi:MAG: amidohydrolase family protein [Eubacteriales bacterium]